MAPLLRARLTCFYCGCRSTQKKTPGLRKWQCERCEAENFLDENGDIADPPPATSNDAARYAHSVQRPATSVYNTASDSIFCATCLKNQRLLTESLAQYYPSTGTDDLREYDTALPEYRARLEERYPQCCEECEPKARQRLRDTSYAAKTDHLRRIMERTKAGRQRPSGRERWLRLLVSLGGLLWVVSWTGQILWDLVQLLKVSPHKQDEYVASTSATAGIQNLLDRRYASYDLGEAIHAVAEYSLWLGLLSLWWNPHLNGKISRGGANIIGATEYYKLQILALAFRAAARYTMSHWKIAEDSEKALHLVMLVLGVSIIIRSYRVIGIDYTPKVLFKEGPNSLLSQPQRTTNPQGLPPTSRLNPQNPRPTPFPIESLAAKPLPSYQAPTPPESPYYDDDDGQEPMDWTPSQPQLAGPTPRQHLPSSPAKQPLPHAGFRGHLPADVVSPAHRLRNPPNQPSFRAASEATKAAFMSRRGGGIRSDTDRADAETLASEESPDDDDESSPTKSVFSNLSSPTTTKASSRRGSRPADFRNPQFFPPDEQRQNETGLETLLQTAFSIGEPAEVTQSRHRRRRRHHDHAPHNTTPGLYHNQDDDDDDDDNLLYQAYLSHRRSTILRGLLALTALLISYILLYTTPPPLFITRLLASVPPAHIQLFALGIPAVIALRAILSSFSSFSASAASTSPASDDDSSGGAVTTVKALALGQCLAVGTMAAAVLRERIDVFSSPWALEVVGQAALVGIGAFEVARRWIVLKSSSCLWAQGEGE